MLSVVVWWVWLQLFGLVALPLTMWLLRWLPDRGIGLARPVGLLLVGYAVWLLTSLGFLQNRTSNILLVMLLLAVASGVIWWRQHEELLAALHRQRRLVLIGEALFLAALVGFCFFRAHNPDIAYTEKPMEFAFLNGILRSRTFPPNDPWLSGYGISYYYLGYVLAAMLTRLSRLPSAVAFNLTGVTAFALTVSGAFALVYNLVAAHLAQRQPPDSTPTPRASRPAVLTGLLGATLVALMGNLEGVFEVIRVRGWGSEALWRWLDVKGLADAAASQPPVPTWFPRDGWWWWRASRIIHDRDVAGNSLEVISEFPFFSFMLGDNHPHVLALPFVLLALGLALNLWLGWRGGKDDLAAEVEDPTWWQRALAWPVRLGVGAPLRFGLYALLLGGLGFLNTWDYPIYLGITVLVYALARQRDGSDVWDGLWDTVQVGGGLFLLGVLFYLPFYLGFRSQAGGIGRVEGIKTQLHQHLLMFGVFYFLVLGALAALLGRHRLTLRALGELPLPAKPVAVALLAPGLACLALGWFTAALALLVVGLAAGLLLWAHAHPARTSPLSVPSSFVLLLVVAGLLLAASVEFVFLRDSFGTRMNTVFKFYYQAWVLLAVASAYGVYYVAMAAREAGRLGRIGAMAWGGVGALLVLAGLAYTVTATVAKADGFAGEPTLDGVRYVAAQRPDEYAAIQWLLRHAPDGAVMLEAPGGSYTEYNWISAHTGIPTLLGWTGHEMQWRGNYDVPRAREPDIRTIYEDPDPRRTMALLDAYGIGYLVVGPRERLSYQWTPAAQAKLDRIMVRAFENESIVIYARR